jgi:hypothetical protein
MSFCLLISNERYSDFLLRQKARSNELEIDNTRPIKKRDVLNSFSDDEPTADLGNTETVDYLWNSIDMDDLVLLSSFCKCVLDLIFTFYFVVFSSDLLIRSILDNKSFGQVLLRNSIYAHLHSLTSSRAKVI